jgi:N-hydroxyarylamine O-acetyltransferase
MIAAAYLERISYSGPTAPTVETLSALHRAHMLTVPFENLDIALHHLIPCDESAAVHKIVNLKRGGFCYELNGAFSALLRALGFKVTMLSARVAREDGSASPEFDHLTLRVDFEDPWLADVGFGDSFRDPLQLKADLEQPQDGRAYRFRRDGASIHMERTERDGSWKLQYSFTQTPRQLRDFAAMCHYHQTSPKSHFTQNTVCTRATLTGRITLADRRLIVTENGQRTERQLESEEEWRSALKEHFNVVL